MERTYEFTIGQKVSTRDDETGQKVWGKVVDKTSEVVVVKWEDLTDNSTHERSEFYKISIF